MWEEDGALDMWQRANTKVRKILDEHKPEYLDTGIDSKIRQNYNILLAQS